MPTPIDHLAAAIAAALKDPEFAAAVHQLQPTAPSAHPSTLDVTGAAAFLHLPATTVRQYAREGRLPAYKAGRQWLFFREDLERSLRSNLLAA